MKKTTTFLKAATLSAMMILAINVSSQNATYNCNVQNETMVSPNIYQFDIYIYQTGALDLFLLTYQLGLKVTNTTAILNGGSVTASYVAGSTQLQAPTYEPSGINKYMVSGSIILRVTGPLPTSCGMTIPSTGLRIGTFRVVNTADYLAQPVLAWNNSSPATTLIYANPPTDSCGANTNIMNMSFHTVNGVGSCNTTILPTNVLPCYGDSTGAVNLGVTAGTAPYTYNWSNGDTTQDLSNIPAATYTVTVTDATGCTTSNSVTITQPASPIVTSIIATNVLCFGDLTGIADLTVSGGVPNYTYQWSNGSQAQDLTGNAAGVYAVSVSDANGCVKTDAVSITQPNALSGTLTTADASCFNCPDGTASITPLGGTPAYSIAWNPPATNPQSLLPGTYWVVITDANGCTYTEYFVISYPNAIVENASNSAIYIFPNPASSVISIELGVINNAGQCRVYDILGTEVINRTFSENKFNLDVNNLTRGMYLLKVETEAGIVVRRFVKE